MAKLHIGIDVGGTFTDLFLLDQSSGETTHHKLPSTPAKPHEAPVQGLIELLRKAKAEPRDVALIGLGTTVATNTLLERKGASTALITTKGFRDLIEIGRQKRPHVFDMFARKPTPLASREHRFEVEERIAWDGSVLQPFSRDDMRRAIADVKAAGLSTVAVCFLHSYANPDHEQLAAEMLADEAPDVLVTTSEALLPEFREFERISTTVMNAYLLPVMQEYLAQFTRAVRAAGIACEPFVMNSSGGVLRPELAGRRPIETLFSGPSGGVSGATFLAGLAGHSNIINFDMGGTSTEVCVVREGKPEVTNQRNVDGLPVKGASIDVHTIGAGGSSIAWIDGGGMLRVGPESVGADPGPACYGRGGTRPTLTDANVVLGRLNRKHLLGGQLPIDAQRSHEAIRDHIARPKNLGVEEAAASILAVSNVNIAQAIRFVSTERGLDPAEYTLVAFGGAGPLHAAEVARELGMKGVLVPEGPGVLCAMGVLTKNIELDMSASRLIRSSNPEATDKVTAAYGDLEARARTELEQSGVDLSGLVYQRSVDARYVGQNFELAVSFKPLGPNDDVVLRLCEGFHDLHRQRYGYAHVDRDVELVTFRVKAVIAMEKPRVERRSAVGSNNGLQPSSERQVFFGADTGFVDCPVYDRTLMHAGHVVRGPAIVEQMDTTTAVPPDFIVQVDDLRNLYLSQSDVA